MMAKSLILNQFNKDVWSGGFLFNSRLTNSFTSYNLKIANKTAMVGAVLSKKIH